MSENTGETYTFQDINRRFTITVKNEFLSRCPEPAKYNIYQLNNTFYMFKYLHNPIGPAVIRHKDNLKEYWIDAVHLDVDDPNRANRIRHNEEFNKKVDKEFSSAEAASGSTP